MRSLLVCPDDFLFRLLRGTPTPGEPPLYLVEDRGLRARIARRGAAALAGDLEDPALYRRAFRTGRESVLLAVPHERRDRVLEALRTAAPLAPVVVLKDDARALDPAAPGVTALSAGTIGERVIQPELERAALRARVDRLRAHLAPADRRAAPSSADLSAARHPAPRPHAPHPAPPPAPRPRGGPGRPPPPPPPPQPRPAGTARAPSPPRVGARGAHSGLHPTLVP